MRKKKYTEDQLLAAVEGCRGIVQEVALKLECTRQTVYNYASEYASIQESIDNERGIFVDRAEKKLEEAVERGEWPAIAYTLNNLGRNRGYGDRRELEISGREGGPIEITTIEVVVPDDAQEFIDGNTT